MITTRQARQALFSINSDAADSLRNELFEIAAQDAELPAEFLAQFLALCPTPKLVALYNAHAPKPVKRFSDRKTAERRVAELIEQTDNQPAVEELAPAVTKKVVAQDLAELVAQRLSTGHCPLCGGDPSSQTANGPDGTKKGDRECFCHECGGAYDRLTGKRRAAYDASPSASRAAAIAKSWQDPETAARRSSRMHVLVNGAEYRSVGEAFRALELPLSKHIAFRGQLRDAGALNFTTASGDVYHFELVRRG